MSYTRLACDSSSQVRSLKPLCTVPFLEKCSSSLLDPFFNIYIPALIETQSKRGNRTYPDGNPPRHNDLFVRKCRTSIPDQMSNPVERVIRERECNKQLRCELRRHRPCTERRSDTC